jgi:hypothetical protein
VKKSVAQSTAVCRRMNAAQVVWRLRSGAGPSPGSVAKNALVTAIGKSSNVASNHHI